MRKMLIFLMIGILAGLSAPAFAQPSGTKARAAFAKLREVDSRLERAFHDLRTAEELIDKRRPGGQLDLTVDQALRFLYEAEQRVDQALQLVRGMKPKTADTAAPSHEQLERIERLINEAVRFARLGEQKIDAAYRNHPEDARKIGFMLKQADRNTDAAIKMLRQIIASL